MKCPYCGKRTSYVPDHLKKSENCQKKHRMSLKSDFARVVNPSSANFAEISLRSKHGEIGSNRTESAKTEQDSENSLN